MARVLSVSIGVSIYASSAYMMSEQRLQYASVDAEAFHAYGAGAWPTHHCRHILVLNEKATLASLDGLFASLTDRKPDLLMVFLSGHGERTTDGRAWFCAYDSLPGVPSVDGATLSTWLTQMAAAQTLLLLDCCHAGALIDGLPFFTRLDGARSRVAVASCRPTQRSWEDKTLGHGIFSHCILRTLAVAQGPKGAEPVRVEQLIDEIMRDVPIEVRRRKFSDQEPVWVGGAYAPLLLPRHGRRGASARTVLEMIRRERLRIGAGVALAVLAVSVVSNLLVFHIHTSDRGYIQIARGFRWLSASAVGVPPFVETPISSSSISRRAATIVCEERVWGLWPGRAEGGLRRWWEVVAPYIDKTTEATLSVELGLQPPALAQPLVLPSPAELTTVIDRIVLQPGSALALEQEFLKSLPGRELADGPSGAGQAAPNGRILDFTLLSLNAASVSDFFSVVARFAAVASKDHATAALDWAAGVFDYFMKEESSLTQSVLDPGALERLMAYAARRGLGRPPGVTVPWAIGRLWADALGTDRLAYEARQALLQELLRSEGDTASISMPAVVQALAQSERLFPSAKFAKSPLTNRDLGKVFAPLVDRPNGLSNYSDLRRFMLELAPARRLPKELLSYLFDIVEQTDPPEWEASRALNVLAASWPWLNPTERARLRTAARRVRLSAPEDERAIGALACAGIDPGPEAISSLIKFIRTFPPYIPAKKTAVGYPLVSSTADGAAIALATAAVHGFVPQRGLDALQQYGVLGPFLDEQTQLAVAAGVALGRHEGGRGLALFHDELSAIEGSEQSFGRRELATRIAELTFRALDAKGRTGASAEAATAWRDEHEPELKLSLAELRVAIAADASSSAYNPCIPDF